MDERDIMHRYKASRWALIVGCVAMFIWFQVRFLTANEIRWDYLIILILMLIAKMTARFIYKKTN